MNRTIRILLQTTIPETEDDWHIGRFSLLRDHLASLKDEAGNGLCQVAARNRESDAGADDPMLSTLDRSDFDELWLFAVDIGDGLTAADCRGITRFRQRGGGVHVSIDALGRAFTVHQSIQSLRKRGRNVQVGLTSQEERGQVAIPIDTLV